MPDLTIVQMQQCKSNSQLIAHIDGYTQTGLGSEMLWPHCSCEEYENAKPTIDFGGLKVKPLCRHLGQPKDICGWHEQYSEETQTPEEEEGMICPACGGQTEFVSVGV